MYAAQVTGCLNTYLELRPCRPRIEKLKRLLSECPYRGPEGEIEYDPQTDSEVAERPKKRRKGPRKVKTNDDDACSF